MANIDVTEIKQVHVTGDSHMDILSASHQVADVEESMGYILLEMTFAPPQYGGGLVMQFVRNKDKPGDDPEKPDPDPEEPVRLSYPHPYTGFGR